MKNERRDIGDRRGDERVGGLKENNGVIESRDRGEKGRGRERKEKKQTGMGEGGEGE